MSFTIAAQAFGSLAVRSQHERTTAPFARGCSIKARQETCAFRVLSLKRPQVQMRSLVGSGAFNPFQTSRSQFSSVGNAHRGAGRRGVCSATATTSQDTEGTKSVYGPVANTIATLRAIAFFLTTTAIAVPLFHVMLYMSPLVLMFDKFKRTAMHAVNDIWANLTTLFFYPIEVKGKENLPPKGTPVVYVANHQSYLDIFSLFALHRPFKFVSKTDIFYIPIVGWSMFLTGHVGLKRTDRRSQMACLQDCRTLIKEGASVLFFPEGTRSDTAEMTDFKKGAFSIAAKDNVPVVPITIVGTGQLMQNGNEGRLRTGKVTLIVHPTIQSKSADELCQQSEKLIKDELLKYDYLVKA